MRREGSEVFTSRQRYDGNEEKDNDSDKGK